MRILTVILISFSLWAGEDIPTQKNWTQLDCFDSIDPILSQVRLNYREGYSAGAWIQLHYQDKLISEGVYWGTSASVQEDGYLTDIMDRDTYGMVIQLSLFHVEEKPLSFEGRLRTPDHPQPVHLRCTAK